jgi:hypothetical protein
VATVLARMTDVTRVPGMTVMNVRPLRPLRSMWSMLDGDAAVWHGATHTTRATVVTDALLQLRRGKAAGHRGSGLQGMTIVLLIGSSPHVVVGRSCRPRVWCHLTLIPGVWLRPVLLRHMLLWRVLLRHMLL